MNHAKRSAFKMINSISFITISNKMPLKLILIERTGVYLLMTFAKTGLYAFLIILYGHPLLTKLNNKGFKALTFTVDFRQYSFFLINKLLNVDFVEYFKKIGKMFVHCNNNNKNNASILIFC